MGLTHEDVRRILDILKHSRHLSYVEITLGDYVLRASKTPLVSPSLAAPDATSDQTQNPVPTVAPDLEKNQKTGGAEAPESGEVSSQPGATAAPPPETDIPAGMVAVKAPMAGTFYLRPSPDEPPFVAEGESVSEGETLCLVEVMKMFHSIPAPRGGHVHRILATHGRPVAMGQVLMILAPEEGN